MNSNQGQVGNFERKSALLFAALVLAGGATTAIAQSKPAGSVWNADPAHAATAGTATPPAHNPFRPSSTTQASASAFDRADANKDGQLSPKEASKLPAISQRFKELDTDKNGMLSREEFEKGAHS
jgi:hypothetical protein